MHGIPLFPNLLTHIHAYIYGITHNYVTRSGKTSIIATMTEIHFLGSVSGSCIQTLPRNTKYRIRQNFRGGKLSRLCTTHYSLENFCGASGPCHYVLYTASDSRGKLSRLAKNCENRKSFPPRKFCCIRYLIIDG